MLSLFFIVKLQGSNGQKKCNVVEYFKHFNHLRFVSTNTEKKSIVPILAWRLSKQNPNNILPDFVMRIE